jgi:selenocysteine-specific elongation factor
LLRLDRAVASAIGERFVLRRPRPAGLLAGGVVLDADVPRGRARARLRRDRLVRLVAAVATGDAASVAAARLELHGVNGSMLAPDVQLTARSALLDRVGEYHEAHPDRSGLPLSSARSCVAAAIGARVSVEPATLARLAEATLEIALAQDALEQLGDKIRSSSFTAPVTDPQTEQAGAALVALLDVPAPPPLAVAADQVGCSADVLRVLEQEGRIVVIGTDLAWSADSFEQLRDAALALADAGPLTPAVLRDATGTSRKYVLALLEELDRRGILKRTPAGHVRGPRA